MIPLETLPDAVVVANAEGQIERVNQRAVEFFGYRREELLAAKVELLLPERLHARHVQHRVDYQRNQQVRPMGSGMLIARHKSGRELPVEIMLSPTDDGRVVAVVRDVTRRRNLEQFRDEFVGYISHDLKNPLSVIALQARVLSQQLEERGLPEEEHAVEVIAESAAFIERLVRELLDMSYLESDQVELQAEPTELVPFLRSVLERTVSTSDRARVRLDVHEAAVALIEPYRIERVVVNFVQNAIKYSPPESPILVRLSTREAMARVAVVDRGRGVTPEEAEFVFDKYRRTVEAKPREGLGLGLYISRRIVEAHHGRIGVDTSSGVGATFYFEVPLAAAAVKLEPHSISLAPAPAPPSHAHLAGLSVLLVDDEANAVAALVTLLEDEGLRVTGATSGERALAAAAASPPDVVVVDVEMPGMSGLELLRQLRQRYPELPAIIMSGYLSHHAGIADARQSTGASYVGKPIDVDELLRTLCQLFPPPV